MNDQLSFKNKKNPHRGGGSKSGEDYVPVKRKNISEKNYESVFDNKHVNLTMLSNYESKFNRVLCNILEW